MMLPESRAVDGPRWVPGATQYITTQTDGRGVTWMVVRIEQGGRVLHWQSSHATGGRVARTEATQSHPQYPSDEQVAAAAREERRATKAAFRMWP